MDQLAERQVPRLSLCHPVYRAIWSVCLACGVQLEASYPSNGGCYIRSIRWWVSLTGSVGALLGGQSELYLPGQMASVAVTAFFLWFGVHQFRKTEKSFADLI